MRFFTTETSVEAIAQAGRLLDVVIAELPDDTHPAELMGLLGLMVLATTSMFEDSDAARRSLLSGWCMALQSIEATHQAPGAVQ